MKILFSLAFFFIPLLGCTQILKGSIREYPSGRPLSAVSLYGEGNTQVTTTDGSFTIEYPYREPGDKVRLTPVKGNLKPARHSNPIEVVLRKNTDDWFNFEMCEHGNCPEDEMYKRIERIYLDKIDKLQASIDFTSTDIGKHRMLQDSIIYLQNQLFKKESILKKISKQVVMNNGKKLGQLDPLTNKASGYLEAGMLDSAIMILESANLFHELERLEKKEFFLLKDLVEIRKRKEEFIGATITLAKAYMLNLSWDSAKLTYEIAVLSDTTNFENILNFTHFLYDQNDYEDALKYSQLLLRTAETDLEKSLSFPTCRGYLFTFEQA